MTAWNLEAWIQLSQRLESPLVCYMPHGICKHKSLACWPTVIGYWADACTAQFMRLHYDLRWTAVPPIDMVNVNLSNHCLLRGGCYLMYVHCQSIWIPSIAYGFISMSTSSELPHSRDSVDHICCHRTPALPTLLLWRLLLKTFQLKSFGSSVKTIPRSCGRPLALNPCIPVTSKHFNRSTQNFARLITSPSCQSMTQIFASCSMVTLIYMREI
jgi:hypothetical protein